jgi:dTDP-4-dehydrorhamnose 3,5-epimerase
MIYRELPLSGAFLIEPEPAEDQRGFFARTFCAREFAGRGLETDVAQCSVSYTTKKGAVRGLHYQIPPAAETKLVRCLRGAIFDVIIDLRRNSPTFGRHAGVMLSERNLHALYVPEMFAHGFQTLTRGVEVLYQISEFYAPEHARGLRHDDPALRIDWPLPVTDVSERDTSWPMFQSLIGQN